MAADTPEHVIHTLDAAFMRGDLETIVSLYDERALVKPAPGMQARGHGEIRALYSRLLQPGVTATQDATKVLEADGTALFLSRWTLSITSQPLQHFDSTVVLRKDSETGWKVLIDNARGLAILDTD